MQLFLFLFLLFDFFRGGANVVTGGDGGPTGAAGDTGQALGVVATRAMDAPTPGFGQE
jgi:hypothetical protein